MDKCFAFQFVFVKKGCLILRFCAEVEWFLKHYSFISSFNSLWSLVNNDICHKEIFIGLKRMVYCQNTAIVLRKPRNFCIGLNAI